MEKQIYYFKISVISHSEYCSKRAKLETFSPQIAKIPSKGNTAISEGNRLHKDFSKYMMQYKSFEAMRVKALLQKKLKLSTHGHPVFEKQLDDIILKGMYDDLTIIQKNGKSYVALIELKTTSKKDMWTGELRAAIRQLTLYQWLLKDLLEQIGYPLYDYSLLLIYSQKTGEKLREIHVPYDDHVEDWIKDIKAKFTGQSKLTIPKYRYCSICPIKIKEQCSYFKLRSVRKWGDMG